MLERSLHARTDARGGPLCMDLPPPPGQITASGLVPSRDCDGPERGLLLSNAGPLIEDPGIRAFW